MKQLLTILALALPLGLVASAQDSKPLYANDLEKAEPGKLPDEFLVLDGAFTVQQDGPNKFLELPGAPVESFGLLFGPTEKDGVDVSARILATSKTRRFPTFAVGLNGVGGYRLQVSPARNALELIRGEAAPKSVSFAWISGKWFHLRLRVTKAGKAWKIDGKAWPDGQPEPANWLISAQDFEDLPAGRAGIYGSPISGTPIGYDDLVVRKSSP